MTILKTLLLVFVSLFSFCSYGQTGTLFIDSYSSTYSITCNLYFKGSLIETKDFKDGIGVDFDSLEVGIYKVEVISYDKVSVTYSPIQIKENEITHIQFSIPGVWSRNIYDTIFYKKNELSFNFLTNLKSNDINPFINRNYQLGFSRDVFPNRGKHLSWGILSGSSLSYTDFKNDTSYYSVPNLENERYFSWNIDVSLIGRISFFDMRKNYKNGGYLDLGIGYHFPLLFRHVYSVDNRKFITNKLHNYKNITPLVRIGYNSLAFTYQYQLYDYVDSSFPQNPKHSIGISLVIDE